MGTVKMETKWRDVRKMTFMWRKKKISSSTKSLLDSRQINVNEKTVLKEENISVAIFYSGCAEKIVIQSLYLISKFLNWCDTGFMNQSTEMQHKVTHFCIFSV